MLFHSTRLSTVGGLRCASCHEPWRHFTDGRARALGAESGARNTPSVLNVRLQHWFGWDGANDSLWSQSIRPMLDVREMRTDAAHVAQAMRDDENLKRLYALAFGHAPPTDDETALVDAGKALAAYQETLTSDRTPFDAFRVALARGDGAAMGRYPVAAQRGLRLFIGSGQCVACHAGPNFSDGEFHRSPIVSKLSDGTPDSGRALGLKKLLASPYARSGRFNDEIDAARGPASQPAEAGAFRTPGLREVSTTAPYMHDGSIANLCDALQPHAALQARAEALEQAWQDRPARQDLVEQILAVHEHAAVFSGEDGSELTQAVLRLRGWAVWFLNDLGDSAAQAIAVGEPLLADYERVLGPDHPDTLNSRNDLAATRTALG